LVRIGGSTGRSHFPKPIDACQDLGCDGAQEGWDRGQDGDGEHDQRGAHAEELREQPDRTDAHGHRTPVEAVLAFANTLDVGAGTDALREPADLARWLVDNELAPRTPTVTEADHDRCLRLRAGVREALGAEDQRAHVLADADSVLRELPLLVALTPGAALQPGPELPGASRALATLVAALATVLITGEVERIKRCPAEDCGWVFWDSTKNRSRRWCSMQVCGNRNKARTSPAATARLRGARRRSRG
jgi:predicted RNA-binding Zn ribbon-like protein